MSTNLAESEMNHNAVNPQNSRCRGLTLVELMVVVAVIGILAGLVVPGFVQGRVAANEGAVVGTLRAVSTGQFKFKTMGLVDTNSNGGYEYGTMREMTGGTTLRGSNGDRLSPNLLPMSLDHIDANGRFLKHGYYFQLYLPNASGDGVPETTGGIASIDANNSEGYWTMLAWPVSTPNSGLATYFVNQQGEIVKTKTGGYTGLGDMPAPGAALVGTSGETQIVSTDLAVNEVGADGNTWTSVR